MDAFIETVQSKITSIRRKCDEIKETNNTRQPRFIHHQHRLKLKLSECSKQILEDACSEIVKELNTKQFDIDFNQSIATVSFSDNIGQHLESNIGSNKESAKKRLEQHRMCLQLKFESFTKQHAESFLNNLASEASYKIGQLFCEDFGLPNNEKNLFLEQLKVMHVKIMLMFLQNILQNMLKSLRRKLIKFSEAFLSQYPVRTSKILSSIFASISDRNGSMLSEQNSWEIFRDELARKFRSEFNEFCKLSPDETRNYWIDDIQECTEATMHVIKDAYIGTTSGMKDVEHLGEKVVHLQKFCNDFNKQQILPPRSMLNKVLVSCADRWSLSETMIHSEANINDPSGKDMDHIFRGQLKYTEMCEPLPVYVRRLSGDFCTLDIWKQTCSLPAINHPNILHCYGAYRKKENVYIVTEPWHQSLKIELDQDNNFHLEKSLQIAVQLTEICLQMHSLISIEQITLDNILIIDDSHVKVNLLKYRLPMFLPNKEENNTSDKEAQCIQALGIIFHRLFANGDYNIPVVQELHSLVKHCRQHKNNTQHQTLSLKTILHILMVKQV